MLPRRSNLPSAGGKTSGIEAPTMLLDTSRGTTDIIRGPESSRASARIDRRLRVCFPAAMNRAAFYGACALVCLALAAGAAAPLAWSNGSGFRSLEVHPGAGGKAGFTLMEPTATGIWFTNTLQGEASATNAVAHNGAGVAIGDVDGDGCGRRRGSRSARQRHCRRNAAVSE